MSEEFTSSVKFIGTLNRIIFHNEDFFIGTIAVKETTKGVLYDNDLVTVKGEVPGVQQGNEYRIKAKLVNDSKYGYQYNVDTMANNLTFDSLDTVGQEKYLSHLFTDMQLQALHAALPNPYQTLLNKDIGALLAVKGCGKVVATWWISKFYEQLDFAKVLSDLDDYNITNKMVARLLEKYKTPEAVVDKVRNNPYILCTEVDGIGWKTADQLALDGGIFAHDPRRIHAYIYYLLDEEGKNGNSWCTQDQILNGVINELGEDITNEEIIEVFEEGLKDKTLTISSDHQHIGLTKYYNIEMELAEETIRILDAPNNFEFGDWKAKVKQQEEQQGWEYTEEQIIGIQTAIENNLVLITGLGGTGKTTVVKAILAALGQKYNIAQTALAGRAAAKLSEVTGQEGYTIHRLLGFPAGQYHGFVFYHDCKLPQDIIIVDEVSMIDCYLFYNLLSAVKDGAKVILLGDYGQLESIGCGNVAYDIMHSSEVPTVILTKIHRQAAKSAIITESRKIRSGQQIVSSDWTGTEIRGELQDLELDCYLDKTNTFYEIVNKFKWGLANGYNILDMQILSPVKDKGDACVRKLNIAAQSIYNPSTETKKEITVKYPYEHILREGDKVINTVNNYKTTPNIYNGNIGIIESIKEDAMIIDFVGIGKVTINLNAIKGIELGYAITVHKFQGSSAKYVIIGLDMNAYTMLTRELVYTALTRAEEKCTLVCQTMALRMATSKEGVSRKQTYLQECLDTVAHPVITF